MRKLVLAGLGVWLLTSSATAAGMDASAFRNPPAQFRILKIIHGWPDPAPAQEALIRTLQTQGFGGVVCNVSFSGYLESEARWSDFQSAVRKAREAGMALWLYDEKGYPSATAGGLVLKHNPEWQARGLLCADAIANGGEAIELPLPPGTPRLVSAFESDGRGIRGQTETNLMRHVREGVLRWQAPAGKWKALAITEAPLHEGTHADMSLSDHIPYPNLLDPAPTTRFLELTHARYAQRLPEGLGHYFVSTFTDEPSLMSLFLKPMPYRVVPWSAGLPGEFRRRHGRELWPLVPSLFVDAGNETPAIRHQFWQTVGELTARNFFGQIQAWCATNGVLSGGHLLMEENLVPQVALYGDFMACLRRFDAPSIDCLTSIPEQVPWFIGRMAASAAALENKRLVMCETSDHSQQYRPAGDKRPPITVTKNQVRGTCNRLFLAGVNVITSYYTFRDLSEADLQELNAWVGRCCWLLTQSQPAADIAVVFPTESLWPRFVPARHLANAAPAAARIESMFHAVSEGLFHSGRDFLYVDAQALSDARVEAGSLRLRDQGWSTVILPGADTLPMAAWAKLGNFVKSGGLLIVAGLPPANSEREFPSPTVQELGRELLGTGSSTRMVNHPGGGAAVFLAPGETAQLPVYIQRLTRGDVEPGLAGTPVRYSRRTLGGQDLLFLINDSAQPWSGKITVPAAGRVEIWNLGNGEISQLADGTAVPLDLGPYDARFIRFRRTAARPARPPAVALPQVSWKRIPLERPVLARGEFVREGLSTVAGEAGEPVEGWTISGTLSRSDVDTFLFAMFQRPSSEELPTGGLLRVTTKVPEGQATPAQLLVILREKGGADYLCSSGRWLNDPGEEITALPFSAFQLAGWSNDPDGRLNLSEVTEIRVGWGGYYGRESERVEFQLTALETAMP